MRAYIPLSWERVDTFFTEGVLASPVRACAVDPTWRHGAADIDEEQWEYEAQSMAAQALGESGGLVLAVDVPDRAESMDDGWVDLVEPVGRAHAAAVLTSDLAWFGLQELPELLASR